MRAIRLLVISIVLASALPAACGVSTLAAAGSLQVLAAVGGQPDDITVDAKGRLVWGDLGAGTLDRLQKGRVVVIAGHLSSPEGIVALGKGAFIVAEQGLDRITRIGPHGGRRVLYTLQPVAGQEGVDGIGRDPRTGDLLIPDSPNGTVLRLPQGSRTARVIARGLGRPVDAAVDKRGNVLIPDEHLGTLIVVSPRGVISRRGSLATPDDVAVDVYRTVWITTLGDGGLWQMRPGQAPVRVLTGLNDPQGLTLDACGDPIVVEQGAARVVRLLLTARSRKCAF